MTKIIEAENGIDAIAKYKTLKPDIVTMDITMPEMDGLEALRQIRGYDQDALVVMCSAMGQQQMVIQSVRDGAKDFILKPFDHVKIVETLNGILDKFKCA